MKRQHFLELSVTTRVSFWLNLGTRECLLNGNSHLTCLHAPCDLIPLDPCPSFCLRELFYMSLHLLPIIQECSEDTWAHAHSYSGTSFQRTQSSPVTWSSLSPLQADDHVDAVPRLLLCRSLPAAKACPYCSPLPVAFIIYKVIN